MIKQLKNAAAMIILAAVSTMPFAGDFDTRIADIDTIQSMALAKMQEPIGSKNAEQNIGLVSQVGANNVGYINQTNASNFAAIVQNATSAGVANVAYVFQNGSNNRAMVYQR